MGKGGGIANKLADIKILVPHRNTARIQESHIFLGNYIFEMVEKMLITNNKI